MTETMTSDGCLQTSPFPKLSLISAVYTHSALLRSLLVMWPNLRTPSTCDVIDHTVTQKYCLLLTHIENIEKVVFGFFFLFLFSFSNYCQFLNLSFSCGRSPSWISTDTSPGSFFFYLLLFYLCVFLGDFFQFHQCNCHI